MAFSICSRNNKAFVHPSPRGNCLITNGSLYICYIEGVNVADELLNHEAPHLKPQVTDGPFNFLFFVIRESINFIAFKK